MPVPTLAPYQVFAPRFLAYSSSGLPVRTAERFASTISRSRDNAFSVYASPNRASSNCIWQLNCDCFEPSNLSISSNTFFFKPFTDLNRDSTLRDWAGVIGVVGLRVVFVGVDFPSDCDTAVQTLGTTIPVSQFLVPRQVILSPRVHNAHTPPVLSARKARKVRANVHRDKVWVVGLAHATMV